ncbi:MAG: MOSC domain-containing protein [Acidobacteriota bacterium]
MPGHVVSIHIAAAAGAPMKTVEEVLAFPGRGLEGDRYFLRTGTYSGTNGADREITLIEMEAMDALQRDYGVTLEPGETRRNVATRGVPLNHLVGRVFRVGSTTARGLRLCEPCSHMEKLAGKRVRPGLVHRGGLRAQILTEGWIRNGDEVDVVEPVGPPA